MNQKNIPDVIVGRLPRYLRTLQHMFDEGIRNTSSQELGDRLGISAAQIRKDLSQFGEFGKQGTGYSIAFLLKQLQSILKVDRIWDMALIGAGDLGHAIARYQGFLDCGFRVVAIFDNNPNKVGMQIDQFTIEGMDSMQARIRELNIQVAMMTVPAAAAQEVANSLIECGVKAILCYAPIVLTVPADVRVQYIDPVIHLQRMTYYLE